MAKPIKKVIKNDIRRIEIMNCSVSEGKYWNHKNKYKSQLSFTKENIRHIEFYYEIIPKI